MSFLVTSWVRPVTPASPCLMDLDILYLIVQPYFFSPVISVMFEFLEYSLEHQLPNFSECWWDHWILDVLICNGGGTLAGIYTLRWLRLKVRKPREFKIVRN